MGALWFGLALLCCLQAVAQDAEHHSRRHRRSETEASDSDSGESSSERRKRRREERARRKAEEAAQASAGETTESPQPPKAEKRKKGAAGDAAAASAPPPAPAADALAAPEPPEVPPAVYVSPAAKGPAPYPPNEVLDGEGALDEKRLPPVASLNFASATPEQLRKLDGRLGLTLEEMQGSEPCLALRTASRVPIRNWLTREHQRELVVRAGLFVAALFMAAGFRSRAMKAIMPMVPFLACLYVGYDMMARAEGRVDSIARGLRACSATLGEGKVEKPEVVQERFERLTRVRDNISAAYERENRIVERVMDQYRM